MIWWEKIVPFMVVGSTESTNFLCSKYQLSVPQIANMQRRKARQEWLNLVLRTREMMADLGRIEANRLFICERHFKK